MISFYKVIFRENDLAVQLRSEMIYVVQTPVVATKTPIAGGVGGGLFFNLAPAPLCLVTPLVASAHECLF